MEDNMPARMRLTVTIAVVAICFSDGAFAGDGARPGYTLAPIQGTASSSRSANTAKMPLRATSWKQKAAQRLAAGRDPSSFVAADPTDHRYSRTNHRPHKAGSRRQERYDPHGRLAYNPGRDDWEINAPLPHPVAFDLVVLFLNGDDEVAKTLVIPLSLLASPWGDRRKG